MDIKEAFVILLDTPELAAKSGLSDENKRFMRFKIKNNKTILEDTMRKYLEAAGFTEHSSWVKPKKYRAPR